MDVLMRLGDFRFAMDTAAHEQLRRTVEHRWPSQERLWNASAVQYTGRGDETIELSGKVVPLWRGGLEQLNRMRDLAAADEAIFPEPLPLVTGYGEYLGEFVIERVDEQQTSILTRGAPGQQQFSLSLKRYVRDIA